MDNVITKTIPAIIEILFLFFMFAFSQYQLTPKTKNRKTIIGIIILSIFAHYKY